MKYEAECVTKWHPDKICDQISDAILDECLKQDKYSRVAIEVIGGHNTIVLIGEVTTKAKVDFAEVARETYYNLTKKEIGVLMNVAQQAPEISTGVNNGGAGDQSISVGYACLETENHMPYEMNLSRQILKPFKSDGKCLVTMDENRVTNIILSIQGKSKIELLTFLKDLDLKGGNLNYYCNNTGSFEIGGFDADSGVTGRKIVVDAYGTRIPVGGGCFSGKDPTKLDRSGAYMARWVALNFIKKGAKEAIVRLVYVIGKPEPIVKVALIEGKKFNVEYDCRMEAIIERFDLRRPIYLDTAANGHFGRKELPWEKI